MTQEEITFYREAAVQAAIVLLPIFLAIWGFIKAKYKLSEGKWAKIIEIVEMAVTFVYDTYVRPIKYKVVTGKGDNKKVTWSSTSVKLTPAQIKKAQDMAWDKCIELAKKAGIDFTKYITKDTFVLYVGKAIAKLKNG
jgi:hypothetical protein